MYHTTPGPVDAYRANLDASAAILDRAALDQDADERDGIMAESLFAVQDARDHLDRALLALYISHPAYGPLAQASAAITRALSGFHRLGYVCPACRGSGVDVESRGDCTRCNPPPDDLDIRVRDVLTNVADILDLAGSADRAAAYRRAANSPALNG